jgi:hypothetical protein
MTGWAGFIGNDVGGDVEQGSDPLVRARLTPEPRAPEPDRIPDPGDAEERAWTLMVTRKYEPGQLLALGERMATAQAELADEQEKAAKAARRAERIRRAHEAGQITAMDIARMDLPEPDLDKIAKLEHRVKSLSGQIAGASARISLQQQRPAEDPLEATTRRAHQEFLDATRAKLDQLLDETMNAPMTRQAAPPKDAGDGSCGCGLPHCPDTADRAGYADPYGEDITRICTGDAMEAWR